MSILSDNILSKQMISRRTIIIGAGKLGLLLLLAGRMFYMQFIKKDEYKTLSDQNRIKMVIIPPTRGQIYDRNMQVLAKNNSCFRLLLDKNLDSNFTSELDLITRILELDPEQTREVAKRAKKAGKRVPVLIIDCLNWQQISIIEEHKALLKSLFVDVGSVRFYKYGEATAHLIGYMGKISQEQKDQDEGARKLLIDESFRTGKNGVEKFYEEHLRGEFGYKQIEVNAHGKYVRELSKTPSNGGDSLQLNIDARLQQEIMPYLNPRGSSVVVMDCQDGGILLASSSPSYDPNNFNFLSSKYWSELLRDAHKPLINKTVHSLYPPGSIFKLITVLAALEAGIDPLHIIHCNGGPALGGNSFRCANKAGHGAIDMQSAVKYSCNIYMFELSKMIGPEIIISTARKFGFGSRTNIDLPNELAGFVPDPEWKKQTLKAKWSLGDTFNLAIGQGYLLSTPMQLTRFISSIATGGKLYTPKVAKSQGEYVQLDVKNEHFIFLKKALYGTVNTLGGTGYLGRLSNSQFTMSGKTGTAQVMAKKSSNDDLSRDDIAWHRRNHAMFAGYAPSDDPRYAVVVYYDHGGGGGRSAAPIAKLVMEKTLNNLYSPVNS